MKLQCDRNAVLGPLKCTGAPPSEMVCCWFVNEATQPKLSPAQENMTMLLNMTMIGIKMVREMSLVHHQCITIIVTKPLPLLLIMVMMMSQGSPLHPLCFEDDHSALSSTSSNFPNLWPAWWKVRKYNRVKCNILPHQGQAYSWIRESVFLEENLSILASLQCIDRSDLTVSLFCSAIKWGTIFAYLSGI